MKLSIIIVSYNVRYFLEQCLLSVYEAIESIDSEIIVVDNCSHDDSLYMLQNQFPKVTVIKNKINVGFAKANNQGVSIARGEYVCLLNPDTVIGANIFKDLLGKIVKLPHAGLLGPRLINGRGDFLHESKRNIPSPLSSLTRLFGIRVEQIKSYYADHISGKAIGDVDILVGAFLFVKKEIYKLVEGFDEDYFMYAEDIDLSYKIKKKGLQNYYIGNVCAIHYKGESTDRNATYVRRFYTAMRLFYKKHFKSTRFLDFLISIAIHIVSRIQSFKNFEKEKRKITLYCLLSNDNDLYDLIKKTLGKNLELRSSIGKEDLGDQNIEIIFDNSFISFDEIINQMQKLRKRNVTFRIRPKNRNYIIGSDFSDGKGEVLSF
ncbi:glycosyltransferase family 2 protein [Aquimarina aggregata]|uniref:glycosyltransferase family 2 protein n=1 Tax=Aquimarina aggregata TaxID=1642818 RepID=UPI00249011AD|nr:glycosyltransferase family 2 protein [Aquimarina aggregata]